MSTYAEMVNNAVSDRNLRSSGIFPGLFLCALTHMSHTVTNN